MSVTDLQLHCISGYVIFVNILDHPIIMIYTYTLYNLVVCLYIFSIQSFNQCRDWHSARYGCRGHGGSYQGGLQDIPNMETVKAEGR